MERGECERPPAEISELDPMELNMEEDTSRNDEDNQCISPKKTYYLAMVAMAANLGWNTFGLVFVYTLNRTTARWGTAHAMLLFVVLREAIRILAMMWNLITQPRSHLVWPILVAESPLTLLGFCLVRPDQAEYLVTWSLLNPGKTYHAFSFNWMLEYVCAVSVSIWALRSPCPSHINPSWILRRCEEPEFHGETTWAYVSLTLTAVLVGVSMFRWRHGCRDYAMVDPDEAQDQLEREAKKRDSLRILKRIVCLLALLLVLLLALTIAVIVFWKPNN